METSPVSPEYSQDRLLGLFESLRQRSFALGMEEYMAARFLLEQWNQGNWSPHWPDLGTALQLLWCKNLSERATFHLLWQEVSPQIATPSPPTSAFPASDLALDLEQDDRAGAESPTQAFPPPEPDPPPADPQPNDSPSTASLEVPLETLPVRAPYRLTLLEDLPDLTRYTPLTARAMAYGWRYLRRPVATGPIDVLDLEATVEQSVRQGFYLAPVYRRRYQNAAQLLLLIDQRGSMVPFHALTRDLVETVTTSGALQESQVEIFYFQNSPLLGLYADRDFTTPYAFAQVLETLSVNVSVLIVSDAGAARGQRHLTRIEQTILFLVQILQETPKVAWLNPMPEYRWSGSSAEMVALHVPMYPLSETGFSQAIDTVRGQPLAHYLSSLL